MRLRVLLGVLAAIGLAVPTVAGTFLWWQLTDTRPRDLPLPPGHVALHSAEGRRLLDEAEARTDLDPLLASFQSQEVVTWCGVASSVTVLGALDPSLDITQRSYFDAATTAIRPWHRTTFGGMPIGDLAAMLETRGVTARTVHAEAADVEAFRAEVLRNLATAGDFLVVNYDRRVLLQEGGGHISPLGAYDADSDQVLLLDVAAYKYPPMWLPLTGLFDAMDTPDSESGRSRGWVVVRR